MSELRGCSANVFWPDRKRSPRTCSAIEDVLYMLQILQKMSPFSNNSRYVCTLDDQSIAVIVTKGKQYHLSHFAVPGDENDLFR